MNIALLEDDHSLRKRLSTIFRQNGWKCEELDSIQALNEFLDSSESIDVFVLDRLIGKTDAAEFIVKIRKAKPDAKVLVLSSINIPEERAKWLMAGAHEYMGKPVFTDELVARLHHLKTRESNANTTVIKVGDLLVDKYKHFVTSSNGRLDFTAKEYSLFLLLLEYPGRVFSKLQLIEHVWDYSSAVETNVVESTVNHIRRKLESVHSTVTIKSRRNVGYWIEV